ncbi:hypothetical protein HHI36_001196 [Cryptolaemus montrouzieri]|uniref:Uncharacterized protein n=1 Tax=Cryptolaemus montrouzieri TaxID=559131 RepID=A0ABD2P7L2_9CUCU
MESTEDRMNKKLEKFRKQLNEGLEKINDSSVWYKMINTNEINFHLLTSFQLANKYLSEIYNKYRKWIDICYHKGVLTEFLPPSEAADAIKKAESKLPSMYTILQQRIERTEVEWMRNPSRYFLTYL